MEIKRKSELLQMRRKNLENEMSKETNLLKIIHLNRSLTNVIREINNIDIINLKENIHYVK